MKLSSRYKLVRCGDVPHQWIKLSLHLCRVRTIIYIIMIPLRLLWSFSFFSTISSSHTFICQHHLFLSYFYFSAPSIPLDLRAYVTHPQLLPEKNNNSHNDNPLTMVILQWQAPEQQNGVLTHYRLHMSEQRSDGPWSVRTISDGLKSPSVTLEELHYGKQYFFQVRFSK